MPDKPSAELALDEPLVRALLRQASAALPDAATMPLEPTAEGWDCAVWRLGDRLAVRLPRRALAAPLVRNEQRWLPELTSRVAATGVLLPTPVFAGVPDAGYPWPWSIVPWIPGTPGLEVARADRTGWARSLAEALVALHRPAPPDHPVNPYRGVPLADRDAAVRERFDGLRAAGVGGLDVLASIWASGVSAPSWEAPAVWIHGDLHPGNLVADGRRLVGVIDFGDITAGDPAYDLSVAWLAFDDVGRAAFIAATGSHYDESTWTRAEAWAVSVTLMLLNHSDDDPAYAALGAEAAAELSSR